MCYCPTPTLHPNLALTGDGAFIFSLKKTHSVWFISVLNYGDTENVLINHLLLVIPMSYPCHYTHLCPHKPHKHAHTHTHTHTHTHMLGFHVLWGLSIDVMVFILYKLYILSPYTAPIPKPIHHRRHSAILHFQKTSLSLIYKLVSSWGPKNVPTRTRILDIAIVVGTFCPHNVGFTWTTHTHTHTHTRTHTHTHTCWYIYHYVDFPYTQWLFYPLNITLTENIMHFFYIK